MMMVSIFSPFYSERLYPQSEHVRFAEPFPIVSSYRIRTSGRLEFCSKRLRRSGSAVTLAGKVPNAAVRADAATEARAVKSVVRLNNELQVKAPPTS
jgi:hypothetical protein